MLLNCLPGYITFAHLYIYIENLTLRRFTLIIFLLTVAIKAYSQSLTQSVSGSITISSAMSVGITGGATISFTSLDDYTNGKTLVNYATCTLRSNQLWLVSVRANATYFTAGSGGSTDMPAGILSIRKNGTTSFLTISSSSSVTLATGSRTSSYPYYTTYNVDVKANPGYSYNGGTYSIGLIYTLTNQ